MPRKIGLSSLLSIVAIVISFSVYVKTMPKERPVISLSKTNIKRNIQGDILNVDMVLHFKNIGFHPATKINFEMAYGIQNAPNSFKNITNQSIANTIGTGNVFRWTQRIKLTAVGESQDDKPLFTKGEIIFLIRIRYEDLYDFFGHHKRYKEDFWITYKVAETEVSHATVEQVNRSKAFLLRHISTSKIHQSDFWSILGSTFRESSSIHKAGFAATFSAVLIATLIGGIGLHKYKMRNERERYRKSIRKELEANLKRCKELDSEKDRNIPKPVGFYGERILTMYRAGNLDQAVSNGGLHDKIVSVGYKLKDNKDLKLDDCKVDVTARIIRREIEDILKEL
jgi:hypothetical protein